MCIAFKAVLKNVKIAFYDQILVEYETSTNIVGHVLPENLKMITLYIIASVSTRPVSSVRIFMPFL